MQKWRKCRDFIDSHPRLGWYVAFLASLNVVLNILDLLK
jgi:hypothetical protein